MYSALYGGGMAVIWCVYGADMLLICYHFVTRSLGAYLLFRYLCSDTKSMKNGKIYQGQRTCQTEGEDSR